MIGGVKCPECGAMDATIEQSATAPGLARCSADQGGCGKVFPIPDELIKVMFDADDAPGSTREEELVIPDVVSYELGWRAWIVEKRLDPIEPPILISPAGHAGSFWIPGQPMVATCSKTTTKVGPDGTVKVGHEVPHSNCACGLYSAKDKDHMLSQSYHRYDPELVGAYKVIGKVKLWGKDVIEGTLGWRAKYGYPEELYLPYTAHKLLAPLGEAYGVPVMLDNWYEPPLTRLPPKEIERLMKE